MHKSEDNGLINYVSLAPNSLIHSQLYIAPLLGNCSEAHPTSVWTKRCITIHTRIRTVMRRRNSEINDSRSEIVEQSQLNSSTGTDWHLRGRRRGRRSRRRRRGRQRRRWRKDCYLKSSSYNHATLRRPTKSVIYICCYPMGRGYQMGLSTWVKEHMGLMMAPRGYAGTDRCPSAHA